ncbi:hypothetical protein [Streptomyces sp. NPDC088725]|uniref:hypothetical protein n=1 Tax=Streptomyces sp. NPDC088725 TaxID=3365873 RepID=UPI0037F8498C
MTRPPATAPSSVSGQDAPPSDYRLLLPDGWFRIDLTPQRREESVTALVEKQFAGYDSAPLLKEELRKDLKKRAAKAYRSGGIELYLSLQQAGPFTVPASLLVTLAPLQHPEPLPLEALAQSLVEDDEDREVSIGELRSSPAVRVRKRQQQPSGEATGRSAISTSVDYHIPVPGSTAFLLLSFSTPLEVIADAMTHLFDAIADTLVWVDGATGHD